MSWTVTIFNPDGTTHATPTAGAITQNGPGVGKPVVIPSQSYTCGFNHTLTGTQNGVNSMGGNGVSPWPDPGSTAEKSPAGDDPPSWDATGGSPEPKPPK